MRLLYLLIMSMPGSFELLSLQHLIVKARHLCLWFDMDRIVQMEEEAMVLVVVEVEKEAHMCYASVFIVEELITSLKKC